MKKILVRAPQWLGDAVVSTVFLNRLKINEPESEISVLCVPSVSAIFKTHPAVHSVIELPYPQKSVFAAAALLRNQKFDEAYVLPRSFRSALEIFLARIPRRIGYTGDLRRLLLTKVSAYNPKLLYAHRYLKLIGEETIPLSSTQPYFPSSSTVKIDLSKLKKPLLGIAPISVAPSRTWLADRFAEVANRWQEKNQGTVILFGSKSERASVQAIADKIRGTAHNTAGELNLPELGGILSRCDLFLANDSGLMHVASAFQVPTVVLFGASDPTFALPPWGKFIPLQHPEIFCVPCAKNHCVRLGEGHLACLKSITPSEVTNALLQL